MAIQHLIAPMLATTVGLVGVNITSAQDYPNKTIRIIAGTGPVGLAARLTAQGISGPLGQPVIVENRTGVAQGETVAKAAPDGYTVLVSAGNFWIAPLLRETPYDPIRDFAPISLLARQPLILYVHPSLPVKSVKELIALAKSRPGELNNSIGGIGGTAHFAGELFKSLAGVKIVAVPYSSDSQEVTDLLSGRVQLTITSPASMMEHVKLGKLRALAVTSAEPSVLVPGLPTVAASLPGYEVVQSIAMFAPSKTPEAIINRLNQEVLRFLKTPEAKERALNAGVDLNGSSPGELAAIMKSDLAKVGKVIKEAGIKVN